MKREIDVWIKQALRDYKSAKNSYNSKDYYVTALLCQQAVEKGLKYLLLKKGDKLLKIHDLVILARRVNVPQEIEKYCSEITPLYMEVRYPDVDELPSEKVDKADAEYIIKITHIILKWLQNQS